MTDHCNHNWERYNRFWFDGRICYRCFECGEEITEIDGRQIPQIEAKIEARRVKGQA